MSTPSNNALPPEPKYAVNDIVHIIKPTSTTAAAGFGTAHPTNLELVPNTIWSIREVKPSLSSQGSFSYTAIPLTMTELIVDEAQVVYAQIPVDAEVVKVGEENKGLSFVYKVKEVRVVWDKQGLDLKNLGQSSKSKQDAYCVMVRMQDELGQLRDCKADELRMLTDEEKAAGRGFWPVQGFGGEAAI